MHVLITEPSQPVADAAAAQLRSAGHVVHQCAEDDAHAVCMALRGRACPLDSDPIDVVIDVRPAQQLAGVSEGVRCASRRGIPTILASEAGVVEAAEAARDTPSPRRSSVATAALEQNLALQGFSSEETGQSRATVSRRWGGMYVQVEAPESVDARAFGQAAIRIHQELRAVDPWARTVDIARKPGP